MTPISKHPEFVAATTEVNGLAIALGKVHGRLTEIDSLLRSKVKDDRESSHVAAAMRFAETGRVEGAGNIPNELSEERSVLLTQAAALSKAIATRQQALAEITRKLSAEVCRDLQPKHHAMAARYLSKLKELDAMYEEEDAFMRAIESNGYEPNFSERISWAYVGRLSQMSEATIWHHAREVEKYVAINNVKEKSNANV